MYFVWGVLFAYLALLPFWLAGKIEVRWKTGPPKPRAAPRIEPVFDGVAAEAPPPKPVVVRKETQPKSNKPHEFDGIRVEILKEGGRIYAVTTKNGKVTDKSLCPSDRFSAEDWERTVRAGANLMGLTKVGEWAWEWRGPKPCPPGTSYTTTHHYDRKGNLVRSEKVYHE